MMSYKKPAKCHTDGMKIMQLGSASIHASNSSHEYTGYALIVNISGYSYSNGDMAIGLRGAAKMMQGFLAALPTTKSISPPELEITWADGGAPNLAKADWMRLIDDLSKVEGKVLVHCMGGHGRTGTALAILLSLSKALTKDPVKWLRKHYCEKVVESKQQFEYLKKLDIVTACDVEKRPTYHYEGNQHWLANNWKQDEYNLTKRDSYQPPVNEHTSLCPTFTCILCCRKHIAASFYQTFMDGTGFCWQCHQLCNKTNPDIQSA